MSVLVYIYKDELKNALYEQLNEYLATEVIVDNISVSFRHSFPDIAVTLKDVIVKGTLAHDNDLMEVKKIHFVFSVVGIIKGDFNFKSILLDEGHVSMLLLDDGSVNYNIFKAGTETEKPLRMSLSLKKVEFKNMNFNYEDRAKGMIYSAYVDNTAFSGSFSSTHYKLSNKGSLLINTVMHDSVTYLSNRKLNMSVSLDVDREQGLYTISDGAIDIEGVPFFLSGDIKTQDEDYLLNLKLVNSHSDMKAMLALLPSVFMDHISEYKASGPMNFELDVNGILSKNENPLIEAKMEVKNGKLSRKGSNARLDQINFSAFFTNGNQKTAKTTELHIIGFNALLNKGRTSGNLILKNTEDPYMEFDIKSDIFMSELAHFLGLENKESFKGEILLDVAFKGRLNDAKDISRINRTQMQGNLLLANIAFKTFDNNLLYHNLNGRFNFDGNNLNIFNFSGQHSNSDFLLNGYVQNIATFLFSPERKLLVHASLKSKQIDLNEFLIIETSTGRDTVYQLVFPDQLLFDLRLDVAQLNFKKFKASNVKGRLSYIDRELFLSGVSINTMNGNLKLEGLISTKDSLNFIAEIKSECKNIDIEQLFYQCENFGQGFITNDHLRGALNGTINLSMEWDQYLNIDAGSVLAQADLSLYNGELIEFMPIVEMSRFVKMNRLRKLTFSEMHNTISIKNERVYIPKMEINSNALDMTLYGEHTFDNEIDYYFRMNVSNLLFGSRQDYETEFGKVVVNERDAINLFVVMSGTGEEPNFKMDAAAVRAKTGDFKKQDVKLSNLNAKNKDEFKVLKEDELVWEWEDEFKLEPEKTLTPTEEKRRDAFRGLRERLGKE